MVFASCKAVSNLFPVLRRKDCLATRRLINAVMLPSMEITSESLTTKVPLGYQDRAATCGKISNPDDVERLHSWLQFSRIGVAGVMIDWTSQSSGSRWTGGQRDSSSLRP